MTLSCLGTMTKQYTVKVATGADTCPASWRSPNR